MKNYLNRNVHVFFGGNAIAERNLRSNMNSMRRLFTQIHSLKANLNHARQTNNVNKYAKKYHEARDTIIEMVKRLNALKTKYNTYGVNTKHIKENINHASRASANLNRSSQNMHKKFTNSRATGGASGSGQVNNTATHVASLKKQINNIKRAHLNSGNFAHLSNNIRQRMITLFIMNDPRVKKLQNELNFISSKPPSHKPKHRS